VKPRRKVIFQLSNDMVGIVIFRYGRLGQHASVRLVYYPGVEPHIGALNIVRPGADGEDTMTIALPISGPLSYLSDCLSADQVTKAIWDAAYNGYKDFCRSGKESS
jgi:hypothetical protein